MTFLVDSATLFKSKLSQHVIGLECCSAIPRNTLSPSLPGTEIVEIMTVANLTKIVILPFNFEKTGISSWTFSLKFYVSGNEDAQDRVFCIYVRKNGFTFYVMKILYYIFSRRVMIRFAWEDVDVKIKALNFLRHFHKICLSKWNINPFKIEIIQKNCFKSRVVESESTPESVESVRFCWSRSRSRSRLSGAGVDSRSRY